jgi:hypothetical protein
MKPEAWIALVAALIALGAFLYGARAANAAKEQTAIQRQLRIDAAQPYVWVDLRPDDEQGGLLMLVVGNSGPTVATDVRVTFSPPLVVTPNSGEEAQHKLSDGLASLPPGRTMAWIIGVAWQVIPSVAPPGGCQARILATGPFGPLEPLEYVIDVEDLRHTRGRPPGTLHGVASAINTLTKAITEEST